MNIIKWLQIRFGRKIKLVNKDGECIYLPACLSIEDLVRLGFSKPKLKKEGSPLRTGEWEAQKKTYCNRAVLHDRSYNAKAGRIADQKEDA